MAKDLNKALDNLHITYENIINISNDILNDIFIPIDNLINEITINSEKLNPETLRHYIIQLQLKAFEISDVKEKSVLKATCSEALRKEKYALSFNEAQGTMEAKKNIATINSSEELIVESLYQVTSDRLKTKLEQLHRMVDALKSILMSQMQEIKLTSFSA